MSKDTDNSRFIDFSLPRFYQQLIGGIGSYHELGNRIIKQIRTAHAFRQTETVTELSEILINLPIKEYQLIGQYYLVWCKCRSGQYDADSLERIIEQTRTYKAQALLSRGAFEFYQHRNESALYYYTEGLKTKCTISNYIALSWAVAVTKSAEGFHKQALVDLEKLTPIIKHAEPRLYFDFLNSYATELGKTSQTYEARSISRVVLASPFAPAYPEWRDTADELKEPSRSLIAAPSIEPEPVEIEASEAIEAHHAREPEQAASVIAFPALKEAPQPQKPGRLSPQEVAELTAIEKRELILTALRSGAIQDNEYDKLMGMVGLLKSGPAAKILDLEDQAVLDDLIIMWSHQIDPEELAAVMSAIRDCEDRIRQRNILDRIIRIAFEETQLCGLTETEWRLEVERRLPKK